MRREGERLAAPRSALLESSPTRGGAESGAQPQSGAAVDNGAFPVLKVGMCSSAGVEHHGGQLMVGGSVVATRYVVKVVPLGVAASVVRRWRSEPLHFKKAVDRKGRAGPRRVRKRVLDGQRPTIRGFGPTASTDASAVRPFDTFRVTSVWR